MISHNNVWIIGIDEAGRGPLAGPVAVGLFAYKSNIDISFLNGIRDSKKISEKKREEWFKFFHEIQDRTCITYNVKLASAKDIDTFGISVVIHNIIKDLLNDFPHNSIIMLDGTLKAPQQFINQSTIVKGDDKVPCISAASICAKVTRDAYMKNISKKYPKYNFQKHKGYGTKEHREYIKKYNICIEHRKSYIKPIFLP